MKTRVVRAMTAVLISGGIGLTGLGLASGTAQAEPHRPPAYHWCPGDFWNPDWGFNWEWLLCHDEWHRDIDRGWHGRDYHRDGWDRHRGGYGW
jgi:hypothetical protein